MNKLQLIQGNCGKKYLIMGIAIQILDHQNDADSSIHYIENETGAIKIKRKLCDVSTEKKVEKIICFS
jgi:hypothetical protein